MFRLLVPKPQACVCLSRNFRFGVGGKTHVTLYACCVLCGALLYYSPKREKWFFVVPKVYASRFSEE
jgi:hypothetical protein